MFTRQNGLIAQLSRSCRARVFCRARRDVQGVLERGQVVHTDHNGGGQRVRPQRVWVGVVGLWNGCIAGALVASDYVNKLRAAGFSNPEIQLTRAYSDQDIRDIPAAVPAQDRPRASIPKGPWRVRSARSRVRSFEPTTPGPDQTSCIRHERTGR